MFVVAGVTGQTGGAVAEELLKRGRKVRALVRSKVHAAQWAERGAQLWEVDLLDAAGLSAALEGAEGAYLLAPPAYEHEDPNAAACRMLDACAEALERSPVRHVAMLSSIGAQHAEGTGPIVPCHHGERVLSGLTKTTVSFLRVGYFMQNLASFLGTIRAQGVLPVLFSTDRPVAMIAAEDFARMVVAELLEGAPEHRVMEVSGPEDPSFEQVAAVFARVLERPVQAVRVPPEQIVGALTKFGMPPSTAELYREMALGVESGLVAFERGSVFQARGATPLEAFIRRIV